MMLRFVSLLLFAISFTGFCDAQSIKEISMCQGDTAIMSAEVSDADSMQWYYNGHPVPGANNDTLKFTQGGMFYLMAFSEQGKCFTQSDFIRVEISYPSAIDDHYNLTLGRTEALNVLNNDNMACFAFNLSTITITRPPVVGSIMSIANGMIIYKASNSRLLPDYFTYRITDMEGRTTNEARVDIEVDLHCALLYPNPVKDVLNILVDPQKIHGINVYDASGKRLAALGIDQSNMKFNMSEYAQGIYFFEILERNGKGCTLKVQKDK
ncbi:T9SS type A sorting domain-containing protein [Taibaiella lutea]|uniref:T9SS type A sorting domain-containing protein n=1 Tax=Taibaiella lutea TaxID=2608001 RepID=A0A5M6CJ17_9BACT|nr:T9SS type A sorting domain-containing protein [Taibaiella lutea]KAA5535094.1 T9SS type A sorting domain-containing protein [Taibaiella lutea]